MPGDSHSFSTLAEPARRDLRVRDSRFLADAHPVADEAAAGARRAAIRSEFPDATHHCWALRLRGGPVVRELSHDAGEPAGTAGLPILQALRRAVVLDTQVVVVRWFGGTRLGKGGLARAYRDAARQALQAAPAAVVVSWSRLWLSGPVASDGEVRHAVAGHGGRIVDAVYEGDGDARLYVALPEAATTALRDAIARLTRGRWRLEEPENSPEEIRRGG